jgi:hypothetical protein
VWQSHPDPDGDSTENNPDAETTSDTATAPLVRVLFGL